MAFILRLEKRKMPVKASDKFELAEQGKAEILIPSIVFVELAYLSEKRRIDANLQDARKYLDKFLNINESPLNLKTIDIAFKIDDIPELHDRLIAALGKELELPIITNDPVIQKSKHVSTIWKS